MNFGISRLKFVVLPWLAILFFFVPDLNGYQIRETETVAAGTGIAVTSKVFSPDGLDDHPDVLADETDGNQSNPNAERMKAGTDIPPNQPPFDHRLVVKFRDDIKARLNAGKLHTRSVDANELVDKIVLRHGVRFEQLIQLDVNRIAELEERGLANSGRPQPDLAAMMVVKAPQAELQKVAELLHASEFVDWVEFEMLNPPPPCGLQDCTDIAPPTPNYEALQSYLQANPGLNANAFLALGNARGEGIMLSDCEYWFNGLHEDICWVIPEPGQTPHPDVILNNWHQHGTAVMGILTGGDNSYGIRGLVPEAQAFFYPEWTIEDGSRRVTAIANAAASSDLGDVVLLEMQTSIGFGFGPAELDLSVWTVVQNATDAGIIIVAAAGNGDQNLDGQNYSSYAARGDSGAIIVGAGTANIGHHKLSFSTYGSRVNVQGWGQSVFTSGYGSFSEIGGDENQNYTSSFSGTSSASAMLAAVCVSLQSYAVAEIDRRLSPHEMRQVLTESGWPQGSGGNIGRFPDLIDAAARVLELGSQFELGDVNQDGVVNLLDVAPFIDRISTGTFQVEADMNQDGSVDLLDVQPFVQVLTGP